MFSILLSLYFLFIHIDVPEIKNIEIQTEVKDSTRSSEVKNKTSSKFREISTILEVEGDPETHKKYIENYYPTIEVIATYNKLFNGLALKGRSDIVMKLTDLDFVKGIYPVQTYTALDFTAQPLTFKSRAELNNFQKENPNVVLPSQLNATNFTGKGVKVGVVDTGIDFNHPDLISNYQGGFDLVDLDDQPMETTEEQGLATNHGTHVAGIIAADGVLRGVAPQAEIYAYRALGPGGFGTSVHVIAAMEEAVKDGVDVINLSLGNTINGPDYPTSMAVNEATKHGVAVIVANGNSGPNDWTIGAPATASSAFSVGAFQRSGFIPFLYEPKNRRNIQISPLTFSKPWDLTRDYQIVPVGSEQVSGKIGLIELGDQSIEKDILKLQNEGAVAAIIYNLTAQNQQWVITLREADINIPIALVSNRDGRWIEKKMKEQENLYFITVQEKAEQRIANFSSRGPVTVNWMLKPDVIAPGVNILSTVPGGYEMLNGTSMAAPHVAGAVAVIKEAKPQWTNEQIFGALRTTATQITDKGKILDPIIQGTGLVNIAAAIETDTIIDNPLLSFGKIGTHIDERTIEITVENVSNKEQTYYFDIPKKERGLSWRLPTSFTVEPNSEKKVPITLKVNTLQHEKGMYQDWLTLHTGSKSYALPYLFISETADYPRIMGFSFQLSRTDKDKYKYQFYAAERVKSVVVQLYEPNSLVYEGTLLKLTNLEVGMNDGEIRRRDIEKRGRFYGIIVVQLENGELINYASEIVLE